MQAKTHRSDRRWPINTNSLANAVLVAGGTLALWALWRHWFPSAGIREQHTSSTAWKGETAVFAGLATFFVASLGFRSRPKLIAALVSSSLMLGLYAIELVLASTTLVLPPNVPFWLIERGSPEARQEIAAVAARSGVTIDTRAHSELLDDSRRRGIEIVPAVMLAAVLDDGRVAGSSAPARGDELLPLGGISSTLTLLCNQGQVVSYPSDEHGFRNPPGIWHSAHVDLAAVGQSPVQGYCVPDGKGFVDLLRTHHLVALNLGTSGQGSLLQLAAIKEYLPRYTPKTVLWIFVEGIDLPDLYIESTHPLARRYLDPAFSQHLLNHQPEIDAALRRIVSGIETRERDASRQASRSPLVEQSLRIFKLRNLRHTAELFYGPGSDEPPAWPILASMADRVLSDVLAQARTAVSSWGGTLYVVYLPSWNRYRNGPTAAEPEHTKVLSLAHALSIPVIDVYTAFQADSDPLSLFPFRRFGHYNERGNQIVADTILRIMSGP